jgi:hypothetical protein
MVESDAEVLVKKRRWPEAIGQRFPLQSSAGVRLQTLYFVVSTSTSTHREVMSGTPFIDGFMSTRRD